MSIKIDGLIRKNIQDNGYISVANFMNEVIPYYYNLNKNIGIEGDFITSPEISQLFGEMIGLWSVLNWQKLASPQKCAIVELGAGRGKLLNDFLRATKNVPGFHESIEIHIVDISNSLKLIQHKNLSKWNKINFHWHNNISSLPKLPAIFIANEFFDALPIHQYIKIKKEWFENIITTTDPDGEFCFNQMPVSKRINNILMSEYPKALDRCIVEISPVSIENIKIISNYIKKNTGAALIIDYGYIESSYQCIKRNSTLQALKSHKYHPVLQNIGEADITAHVDFFALKKAAKEANMHVSELITQSKFLTLLGINLRAKILASKSSNQVAANIKAQVDRLVSHKHMGRLFKVLSFGSFEQRFEL